LIPKNNETFNDAVAQTPKQQPSPKGCFREEPYSEKFCRGENLVQLTQNLDLHQIKSVPIFFSAVLNLIILINR